MSLAVFANFFIQSQVLFNGQHGSNFLDIKMLFFDANMGMPDPVDFFHILLEGIKPGFILVIRFYLFKYFLDALQVEYYFLVLLRVSMTNGAPGSLFSK